MKLARETAQRAVDLNGDLGASRLAIGFVQLQAGERANADASFRKAAELDPMNPMPHVGLAMNFAADRKNSDAEAAFRKAVELGPKEWRAPAEYGSLSSAARTTRRQRRCGKAHCRSRPTTRS